MNRAELSSISGTDPRKVHRISSTPARSTASSPSPSLLSTTSAGPVSSAGRSDLTMLLPECYIEDKSLSEEQLLGQVLSGPPSEEVTRHCLVRLIPAPPGLFISSSCVW